MRKISLRDIVASSGTAGLKIIKICDHILGPLAAWLFPPQGKKDPPSDFSRILVIRPGGIGDAVFLLPILKIIRHSHPQACVDILCQARNAQVFISQGHVVNRVFCYGSLKDLRELIKQNYDIIVDTEQWHYLTAVTAALLKARLRIGFATRPLRRRFFNVNVEYDSDGYELKNFWRLFEGLIEPSEHATNIENCFDLSADLLAWARLQAPDRSVMLSLAATVPERRLSDEQIIALIRKILEKGFHPVLIGGKDCINQSRRVMQGLDSTLVYNFAGRISLQESAALIKISQLWIGTESGIMHLATAVGTPVIAFFGAGNMNKWMLKGRGQTAINKNLPCSPCTFYGYGLPTCRGAVPCLRTIDLDTVWETL